MANNLNGEDHATGNRRTWFHQLDRHRRAEARLWASGSAQNVRSGRPWRRTSRGYWLSRRLGIAGGKSTGRRPLGR